MRKIIFCLLLFNVLFFTFIKFTSADVINLGKLPSCGFVDGTTNCKNGSYYYVNNVPSSGTKIMSSGRVVDIISFQGSGYFDLFDKSGNLIERLDVNSPDRVSVYVFPKRVYSYTYFGVDLIATHFRQDGGNLGIIVAYKPYSLDLHNFLRGGYLTPEQLPKPDPEPDPEPEVKPGCDICSKIDSILEELKKKNACDVCSKLSGILEDTNKINNNISQLKITTGYINSHLSEIKGNISDNSLILAKVRQTLDTMRMQDLDRNDSLDSIDNKLDSFDLKLDRLDLLEDINNNITGLRNDFYPSVLPDLTPSIKNPVSGVNFPSVPSIDKKEDNTVYFSDPGFEGEAEPLPMSPKEPVNWKDLSGKELNVDAVLERDAQVLKDDSLVKDEPMKKDEPLKMDEFERDEVMERDEMVRDEPLKRDEPLEKSEVLK